MFNLYNLEFIEKYLVTICKQYDSLVDLNIIKNWFTITTSSKYKKKTITVVFHTPRLKNEQSITILAETWSKVYQRLICKLSKYDKEEQ